MQSLCLFLHSPFSSSGQDALTSGKFLQNGFHCSEQVKFHSVGRVTGDMQLLRVSPVAPALQYDCSSTENNQWGLEYYCAKFRAFITISAITASVA